MPATLPGAAVQLPASGHVHLWLAPEWSALSAERQQHYAAWLNEEERERWQRFKFAADRQRFLQARALVRSVLAAYLQQLPAELRFTRNQYGKPQLLQQAPAPIKFNLSHTQGLLALAVTLEAEVGVDVEAITRNVETVALAERFFAPVEAALVKACSDGAQTDCFFRLWTLKEAYVKARGLGLQLGLDAFAFNFNAEQPQLSFVDASDDPACWSFMQLQHAERFRIALAVQAAGISNTQLTLLTPAF